MHRWLPLKGCGYEDNTHENKYSQNEIQYYYNVGRLWIWRPKSINKQATLLFAHSTIVPIVTTLYNSTVTMAIWTACWKYQTINSLTVLIICFEVCVNFVIHQTRLKLVRQCFGWKYIDMKTKCCTLMNCSLIGQICGSYTVFRNLTMTLESGLSDYVTFHQVSITTYSQAYLVITSGETIQVHKRCSTSSNSMDSSRYQWLYIICQLVLSWRVCCPWNVQSPHEMLHLTSHKGFLGSFMDGLFHECINFCDIMFSVTCYMNVRLYAFWFMDKT